MSPQTAPLALPCAEGSEPRLTIVAPPTVLELPRLLFDIPVVIKTKAFGDPWAIRSPCVWTSTATNYFN